MSQRQRISKEGVYFETCVSQCPVCGPARSSLMNVLYDLKNDPYEMNNLLGNNPKAEKSRKQAEYMKKLLVQWLESTESPHVSEIRKRDAVKAGRG